MILPHLLGWNIHQNDAYFITFLVATHLATALVLLGFFWRDWVRIVRGLARSFVEREVAADNTYGKLGWLLVVGTIPAGIIGSCSRTRCARRSPPAVGRVLPDPERVHAVRRRAAAPARPGGRWTRIDVEPTADRHPAPGYRHAVAIGAAQALALIPGFSRSGASMGGGLLVGLNNEDAARFSFLLATPIIGAAAAAQAARPVRLVAATACAARPWRRRSARRSRRFCRCAS